MGDLTFDFFSAGHLEHMQKNVLQECEKESRHRSADSSGLARSLAGEDNCLPRAIGLAT
jgi:hypothetical protein